jgi:uncharacterized protein YecT (DUF1311 family)
MRIKLVILLMVAAMAPAYAQSENDSINCEDPQTQLEMNLCSLRDLETSDKKLNEIYKEIVGLIDAKSKPLLVQAQRNWIVVRDNHCKLYEHFYEGGSMMPMMLNSCRKELTDNRIRELHSILEELKQQ